MVLIEVARWGQIWNLKVQQQRFADGLDVGVWERARCQGRMEVFGLSNWESLEFIPETVGSHRKMLRLGGGGDVFKCHHHQGGSQDQEHRPETGEGDGFQPVSAPNSLWAPGQDKAVL